MKSKKKQNDDLKKLKPKIVRILKKNGIKKAGIFGSYARGDQKKKSDIDILIKYDGGLLKLVGIGMELEKTVKMKVDLLTYGGINPLLRERILNEEMKVI